jgi:hypothetical protein
MMAKQPGYQNSGYKLFEAGFATLTELEKGKLSEWTEEEREKLYESFCTAFGKLEDELDDCAKNVSYASLIKEGTKQRREKKTDEVGGCEESEI